MRRLGYKGKIVMSITFVFPSKVCNTEKIIRMELKSRQKKPFLFFLCIKNTVNMF